MNPLYQKLRCRAKGCRDREIRIKLELILLALKLGDVSEACARRGFSRQFYYRWWKRFKKSGFELSSLKECSRRPKKSPRQISRALERKVHWYARRQYGSRMIEAFLARDGIRLSRSTICHVLKNRKKRAFTRTVRLKTHRKRYELFIPGQRLQMDVKYVPHPVGGARAYTYVIIDECTRWRFAKAFDQICEGTTVKFLTEMKEACPFPIHTIQTDNGQEFTYRLNPVACHVVHLMDAWCKKEGILHRLIPPGVKELNGKVERSHRIDDHYFYWRAPGRDVASFNRALTAWIRHYNEKRPHGGLGYRTPLEKLTERSHALVNEPLPKELEPFRLKFLAGKPKRESQQDRQIRILEKELNGLLRAA